MNTVDQEAMNANFACVKGSVECVDVAELETELRVEGGHLRGLCPLPDHNGDSRSFYVYQCENGRYERWHCHRCAVGGDVIDLYGHMYDLAHNPLWAMEALAERFGLKLWKPEDIMSDEQIRTMNARRKAEKAMEKIMLEQAFEKVVMPKILEIEDEHERAIELAKALEAAGLQRRKS